MYKMQRNHLRIYSCISILKEKTKPKPKNQTPKHKQNDMNFDIPIKKNQSTKPTATKTTQSKF